MTAGAPVRHGTFRHSATPAARSAGRLTLALVVGGLLVRAVIAALVPLLPDEAYYWEWSRRLAAGYFDHPPAVAWLIAAGTSLAGDTPFGVRLGTLVAGTGVVACVAAIARRLGGGPAAVRAAVLMLCMPLVVPGLVIATTDAPALFAVAGALLCVIIAIDRSPGSAESAGWWIAAGAAFGGGLLAKFTVGIVGAAVGAALLARPSLRRQLRGPGPWLAVLCAALVAAPVLWWNAHHGWISVRFQLSHGLGSPARGSVSGRELALLGGQLALVSPGIGLLAIAAAGRALRGADDAIGSPSRDARFLLGVVALLVFAFFAWSAIRRPVEPNWPAPAVLAAMPLLAASSGLTVRRWFGRAAGLGAALVGLALAQLARPLLPIAASRDPVARAHGWPALAAASDSTRRALVAASGYPASIGADRYQDAAEIAFNAPRHPRVFALGLGGRRSQYDLWPSFAQSARRGDGLVVALDSGASGAAVAERLRPHFASVDRGTRVALLRGADTVSVRQLWVCRGWRGSWAAESPGRR